MKTYTIILSVGLVAAIAGGATLTLSPRRSLNVPGVTSSAHEPSVLKEHWLARLGEAKRFSAGDARAPGNAEAFLSLALGESPSRLVVAALHALEVAHAARPQEASRLIRAVGANLDATDDIVLGAALAAGRSLIAAGGDTPAIERQLLDLALRLSYGPGRYALLDTLASLPAARVGETHIAIAQQSLDDEAAFVRSRALRFLEVYGRQGDASKRDALVATVRRSLTDSDPGVRGRAATALASIGGADSATLHGMLRDPVPYVRAQACAALARANMFEDLADILELASSTLVARYDIRGWTTLEGEPGSESHVSSSSGYLGESAATALVLLSHGQVKLEPVASKDIEGALQRNQRLLASWFAKNGAMRD